MSDMTLTKVLRSVGLADRATVHGFRSSFQELDSGADGYPLGRLGGGSCPYVGQLDGTGVRPVRPVRAAPRTDAAVGGLPDRLA